MSELVIKVRGMGWGNVHDFIEIVSFSDAESDRQQIKELHAYLQAHNLTSRLLDLAGGLSPFLAVLVSTRLNT